MTSVSLDDLHSLPAVLRVWSPDPHEPTLAVVLGLSKAATWAAVHAGQLPARRVGHRWLVPTPELLRWLGAKPDVEGAHGLLDRDREQPETSADRLAPAGGG
jgi:excisionase family DNA binding protein